MRAPLLLIAVALAVLAVVPAPSAADHWCNETTADLNPSLTLGGVPNTFVLTLQNTGSDTTTISNVEVLLGWETTERNLGGGSIGPGGTEAFTFTATPPNNLLYDVEVRVTATSDGDVPPTPSTCERQLTIDATLGGTNPPVGGLFAGILLWIVVGVILLVVIVIVIVVVATRAGKSGAPVQPGYGPPPPGGYPPQTPPPPRP